MSTTKTLPIDSIRRDAGTQVRPIDSANVERLVELLAEGRKFNDAPRVFHDGTAYYLSHGFHRLAAYEAAGKKRVECEVVEGTLDDAKDDACRPLNSEHGRPETKEERDERVRRYVERHLDQATRVIGQWCGVSHMTIKRAKEKVAIVTNVTIPDRVERKGGGTYPTKQSQKPKTDKRPAAPPAHAPAPEPTPAPDDDFDQPRDEPLNATRDGVSCPTCGHTEFDDDGDCQGCREPGVIAPSPKQEQPADGPAMGTKRGRKRDPVGVIYGCKAVDELKRIPTNDPLRSNGLRMVADWIQLNCPSAIQKQAAGMRPRPEWNLGDCAIELRTVALKWARACPQECLPDIEQALLDLRDLLQRRRERQHAKATEGDTQPAAETAKANDTAVKGGQFTVTVRDLEEWQPSDKDRGEVQRRVATNANLTRSNRYCWPVIELWNPTKKRHDEFIGLSLEEAISNAVNRKVVTAEQLLTRVKPYPTVSEM